MGARSRASLLQTALLVVASLSSAFAASTPAFFPPSLLPASRKSPLRATAGCRPTEATQHSPGVRTGSWTSPFPPRRARPALAVKMVVLELYCKQAQLLDSLVPGTLNPKP